MLLGGFVGQAVVVRSIIECLHDGAAYIVRIEIGAAAGDGRHGLHGALYLSIRQCEAAQSLGYRLNLICSSPASSSGPGIHTVVYHPAHIDGIYNDVAGLKKKRQIADGRHVAQRGSSRKMRTHTIRV